VLEKIVFPALQNNISVMSTMKRPAWDNTLLTVGFNLRKKVHYTLTPSPAGTVLTSIKSVVLAGLESKTDAHVRRLKPAVNKVLSLRDILVLT
jgi:hypothetical protein